MAGTSVVPLDRKSSIESEPRTLNINQIQFARDAALYVINTRGLEEAMRIFTEGLEPVGHCVRDKEEEDIMEYVDESEGSFLSNPLRIPEIRDIASAPF